MHFLYRLRLAECGYASDIHDASHHGDIKLTSHVKVPALMAPGAFGLR